MRTPTQAAVLLSAMILGASVDSGHARCNYGYGSGRPSQVTNEWRKERNKKRKDAQKAKKRNR